MVGCPITEKPPEVEAASGEDETMKRTVKRKKVRSYLSEFLTVLHDTGVRVGAALDLRIDDLYLDDGEHGAIHWRPPTDEHGKERPTVTPLTAAARAAIDEQLTRRVALFGVDVAARSPWVWPSPRSPVARPWSYTNAKKVVLAAEKLAGLPKLDGGIFHPYRRKWVTERRHLPDADVAAVQGRADVGVMRESYQGTDVANRQKVVDDRTPVEDDQYL